MKKLLECTINYEKCEFINHNNTDYLILNLSLINISRYFLHDIALKTQPQYNMVLELLKLNQTTNIHGSTVLPAPPINLIENVLPLQIILKQNDTITGNIIINIGQKQNNLDYIIFETIGQKIELKVDVKQIMP